MSIYKHMGRISIVVPDGLEGEMRVSAEANTRTLTQEVLHRIKLGSVVGVEVPDDVEFLEVNRVDSEDLKDSGKSLEEYGADFIRESVDRGGRIKAFIEKVEGLDRDYIDQAVLGELVSEARKLAKELGIKFDDNGFYEVVDGRRVNLGNWKR